MIKSKELEALEDLWYGKKTKEVYQTLKKALKALQIIQCTKILHVYETVGGMRFLDTGESVCLTKENYEILKEVLQ